MKDQNHNVKWKETIFVVMCQLLVNVCALELYIEEDQKVIAGKEAELVCETSRVSGDVDECFWESPQRDKYYSSDKRKDGVRVRLRRSRSDDDEYRCILNIKRARVEHTGHWECVVEDRRETVGLFGYIMVYDKAKFQVLLDSDQKQVLAETGDDIELVCPTNERFSRAAGKRSMISLCRWFPPYNSKDPFNIVDVNGVVHNYKRDRIEASDNQIDDGQCGIIIRNLKLRDYGNWRCHLLRKNPRGLGSQSTEANIKVIGQAERLTRDKDDDFDPDEPMV